MLSGIIHFIVIISVIVECIALVTQPWCNSVA